MKNGFDVVIAVVGSLVIPGFGQLFCLRYARAAAFFVAAVASFIFLPPLAVVVYLASAVDARRLVRAKIANQKYCKRTDSC